MSHSAPKSPARRLAGLVTAMALAASVLAMGTPAHAELAAETGAIAGVVTTGTGAPGVAGAEVTLVELRTVCEGENYDSVEIEVASTTTDAGGGFAFPGLAATGYDCTSGESAVQYVLHTTGALGGGAGAAQSRITTTPGGTATVTMVLLPAGTISGRILTDDAAATPIAGVTITLGWRGFRKQTTDADGRYTLGGLTAQSYPVVATSADYFDKSVVIPLATGETVTNADLALKRMQYVTVSGRVTSTIAPDQPLAGISVYYNGITRVTDASGTYSFRVLVENRSIPMSFSDPTGRFLAKRFSVPAPVRDVRFDAVLVETGGIGGTVLVNGATPHPVAGTGYGVVTAGGEFRRSGTTDAQGRFLADHLAPGDYTVSFTGPAGYFTQWWYRQDSQATAREVTVVSGAVTSGIDGLLDSAVTLATVAGTVTLGSGTTPAAGAVVRFELLDTDRTFSAETDATGAYRVTGLLSGRYRVQFTSPDDRFRSAWLGGATVRGNSVVFTAAPSSNRSGLDQRLPAFTAFTTAPIPTVQGAPTTGTLLTAVYGTWVPTPDAFTHVWKRDGAAIAGATGKNYRLTAADLGKRITVSVRATRGTTIAQSRTSAPTAAVATAVGPAPTPRISGSPTVGELLTAVPGTWGPAGVTLSYTWKRDGATIPVTGPQYRLKAVDGGKRITVTVTGRLSGYATVSRTSDASAKVLKVFTGTTAPAITGSFVVGSTLTTSNGVWSPGSGIVGYQWTRDGQPVDGASKRSYTLQPADAGTRVRVTVTVRGTGYATASRQSSTVGTVLERLTATPTPRVVGTAEKGRTLFVATGVWAPSPVQLVFQWKREGVNITGATGTDYTLTAADAGRRITVRVQGSRPGYAPVMRTSAFTERVGAVRADYFTVMRAPVSVARVAG
jgi:hypothetical protein